MDRHVRRDMPNGRERARRRFDEPDADELSPPSMLSFAGFGSMLAIMPAAFAVRNSRDS